MANEKQSAKWLRAPMRGYEKQGWVEVWAGRMPIIVADGFQRTSHGETEAHFGVRITAEALPLIETAPELLDEAKALLVDLEKLRDIWGDHHSKDVVGGAINVAKARLEHVIAKAEGAR